MSEEITEKKTGAKKGTKKQILLQEEPAKQRAKSEMKLKDKPTSKFTRLWLGRMSSSGFEYRFRITGFWSMVRAAFCIALSNRNLLLTELHQIAKASPFELELMARFAPDTITKMVLLGKEDINGL